MHYNTGVYSQEDFVELSRANYNKEQRILRQRKVMLDYTSIMCDCNRMSRSNTLEKVSE